MRQFAVIVLTLLLVSAGVSQTRYKFEFEDVCGRPVGESQIYPDRTGVVTRIVDGDTVEIKDKFGKLWTVELAGAEAEDNDGFVKAYLTKSILKKKVTFSGNPDKGKDPLIEAMVRRKDKDINRHLIERGFAKYRGTEYDYAVSDYELCVLSKLEQKARLGKLGIWADR